MIPSDLDFGSCQVRERVPFRSQYFAEVLLLDFCERLFVCTQHVIDQLVPPQWVV